MDKHTRKIVLFAFVAILLAPPAFAISEEKLQRRWEYNFPEGVGTIAVGNVDQDHRVEILIAVKNNTLQVYDAAGGLKREVYLGSVSDYGTPYVMLVEDIDSDGLNETIIGFGGRRVITKHEWNEYFNEANTSVGRYDRVLQRSIRNKGSVRVYGENFTLKWEYPTELSVLDLAVFDADADGLLEIAAALGGHVQDDWWVKGENVGGKENWTVVEYPSLNGSVLVMNHTGVSRWSYTFNSSLSGVRVQAIAAGYSYGKSNSIVAAGVEDGQYRVFNGIDGALLLNYSVGSGFSGIDFGRLESYLNNEVLASVLDKSLLLVDLSNNTLWRSKFLSEITSTQIVDLDADGVNDILASSRDGYMYVLNFDGSQKWKYLFRDPVHWLNMEDLDSNNLPEIVVGSLENVTVLEFRANYFLKIQADGFYVRAMKSFEAGDYMMARILLDKSEDLYEQTGLSGLRKIDDLRFMISRELTVDAKIRADYLYQKAIESYGLNSYNESLRLASEAKILYKSLNDTIGVSKVTSLESKIADEMRKSLFFRAGSLQDQALSYFGFRNYTASEENAKKAGEIYKNINNEEGLRNISKLLLDIASARYDNARQFYIGLNYEQALYEAQEAERLYSELRNNNGVNQSRQLTAEITAALSTSKEPSFGEKLAGLLPIAIVVLLGLVLMSLYVRKRSSAVDAEKLAESIEDEMGLIPPGKGDADRPF